MFGFYDKSIDTNLLITYQVTPNKNDTFLRKLKIRFGKCDTIETYSKVLTLLELNRIK